MRGRRGVEQRGEGEPFRVTSSRDAEFCQPRLGLLAVGVEAPDGAEAATGAVQHVGTERALVKRGQSSRGLQRFRSRSLLR